MSRVSKGCSAENLKTWRRNRGTECPSAPDHVLSAHFHLHLKVHPIVISRSHAEQPLERTARSRHRIVSGIEDRKRNYSSPRSARFQAHNGSLFRTLDQTYLAAG